MARGADLLLVGGRIFTAARVRPWAQGMAIRDDQRFGDVHRGYDNLDN